MRAFLLMLCALSVTAAAAEPVKIRLRPSRLIEISCGQGGVIHKITGSSDELTLYRVSQTAQYEVYKDDFIVASCSSVFVTSH